MDTQTTFSPFLSDIEELLKLKQTRNLADDNLYGGLRVKKIEKINIVDLTSVKKSRP